MQTKFGSFLAVLAACSSDGRDSSVVVRDSAGVQLVESAAPLWNADDAWQLILEPQVTVGNREGDIRYEFNRISAATRMTDGRIVVADRSNTIRFYGADGSYLSTSGRDGQGPGEFRGVQAIRRYAGDSLLVVDRNMRRLTVLDSSGQYVSTSPIAAVGFAPPDLIYRLPNGRLVGVGTRDLPVTSPLQRQPAALVLSGVGASWPDTLTVFPGVEVALGRMRGGVTESRPPFAHRPALSVVDNLIVVGAGDVLGYDVYDDRGAHVRSVRAASDLTLTDQHLATYKAAALEIGRREGSEALIAELLSSMARPENRAAYTRILTDAVGNVWLSGYEDPAFIESTWKVFDSSGRYLGNIQVPSAMRIVEIGDRHVLSVWKDSMGVESVRLHSVTKR